MNIEDQLINQDAEAFAYIRNAQKEIAKYPNLVPLTKIFGEETMLNVVRLIQEYRGSLTTH